MSETTPAKGSRSGRARGQGFLAVVIIIAVAVSAVALDRLGARTPGDPVRSGVVTGAWFCPHGGGRDWTGWVSVANPDDRPATVRVSTFGENEVLGEPQTFELAPRSTEQVEVPARQVGSGTTVEVFGSRGAAGWVLQAPGEPSTDRGDRERRDRRSRTSTPSGVAAEPCLPQAGTRFLLPDGSTARGEDAYLIVMNPFRSGAVFTVRLSGSGHAVTTTEQVLRPYRAAAIKLNELVLGDASLVAEVRVSVGRVVPSTLGINSDGGIRASVGLPAVPSAPVVLPSGQDEDTTGLISWNPTMVPVRLQATVLDKEGSQALADVDSELGRERAETFELSTLSPAALVVGPAGVVSARRTGGVRGDAGVTTGGVASEGPWIVMPANTAEKPDARLIIASPGEVPVRVTVTPLAQGAGEASTITLEPGTAALGPAVPSDAAALVEADGPVVAVFASFSGSQTAYAVSAGIPPQG